MPNSTQAHNWSWKTILLRHRSAAAGGRPHRGPTFAEFAHQDGLRSKSRDTQAAAYLRNEGAQVASWEEAIPGQADMRPRGDEPSDRRAACATSGILASRAVPIERAIVRACREAGARVGRNVALAAMNFAVPATLVSPVSRDGRPHPGTETQPGQAQTQANLSRARQPQEVPAGHLWA